MRFALPEDHAEIFQVFKTYKTQLPYVRADYLKRKIAAGNVIWDWGVVLIYHTYKVTRLLSHVTICKGEVMISEIATRTPGSGIAKTILKQFLADQTTPVWLTVRADNVRACHLYENCGMQRVGQISWSNRTIPGYIYRWKPNNPLDKFVVVCDTVSWRPSISGNN